MFPQISLIFMQIPLIYAENLRNPRYSICVHLRETKMSHHLL